MVGQFIRLCQRFISGSFVVFITRENRLIWRVRPYTNSPRGEVGSCEEIHDSVFCLLQDVERGTQVNCFASRRITRRWVHFQYWRKVIPLLVFLLLTLTTTFAQQARLIKEIREERDLSDPFFANVDETLFFLVFNGTGHELWKSNGTRRNTVLVEDLSRFSKLQSPTNVDGMLFFVAVTYTAEQAEEELWRSDGTEAGTFLIKTQGPFPLPHRDLSITLIRGLNGQLLFSVYDGVEAGLWKSDGTAEGTVLVRNLGSALDGDLALPRKRNSAIHNGVLFFGASRPSSGEHELWRSDGTTEGTVLLKTNTFARTFADLGGELFFIAGAELWKTDGTVASTVLVHQIYDLDVSSNLFSFGTVAYFIAGKGNFQLWKTDGTDAGTVLVQKDIGYYPTDRELNGFNELLLFPSHDVEARVTGIELWKSDGTEAGTGLLKDITPGSDGSGPAEFTRLDEGLFFVARDELWVTDGTEEGTVLVNNPSSLGFHREPEMSDLTAMNETLFFQVGTFEKSELWAYGSPLWHLSSAQFGDGEGISSSLVLVNASLTDNTSGTVRLFDEHGNPLSTDINGTVRDGQFSFDLPGGGARFFSTDGEGNGVSGSVQIEAYEVVGATVLFSGSVGTAGVPMAQPSPRFLVPIESDTSSGIRTGVALANPTEDAIAVTLRLRDANGNAFADSDRTISLGSRGQVAQFPDEIFENSGVDLSQFQGSLEIESEAPVAGMAVRLSPGQFATLPITSTNTARTSLYFAQFGDGSGISSTLMLLNPSSTENAIGTVRLFDNEGHPLSVDVNGVVEVGEFAFSLSPLSVSFFSTDGVGDSPVTGSVEVESDVPVGGTILFEGSFGVAGVGSVEPTDNFLVPIESDAGSGVRTGVALANPTMDDIEVTVRLRDVDGNLLDNGSLVSSLAPRGQMAQFPDEIFAEAEVDLSQFLGTLEVSSSVPVVGMAIRVSPGEFATLPVTTLE